MADNAAAQPAAAPSDTKPPIPVNPDRVGEELADDANIWHVYDRVAREDDDRRTKAWDTGLNNLALFAGLFSAVTTAFIIEAQQDMEPDYAQLTFLVLNASVSGEKFVQQPFTVSHGARAVNCLWVASLVLSLSAALIAIMEDPGKLHMRSDPGQTTNDGPKIARETVNFNGPSGSDMRKWPVIMVPSARTFRRFAPGYTSGQDPN